MMFHDEPSPQGSFAASGVPRLALKAKALEATAKAIGQLAEKINIESLAGYRVHFHALGCEAQRCRTPAKLALAFA
jgi:hypothetical protein